MNEPLDGAPLPTASTAALRAALDGVLRAHYRARRRVARLERCCSDYYSSFPLEELDLVLDDGTELALVFKDLSWQTLLEDARRAKPEFLFNPRREIEAYQRILADGGLGTAACYGAVADERAGRFWLFLERVPGVPLWQAARFATWQRSARWLAALHARFAAGDGPAAGAEHLLRYDAAYYRLWIDRAREFAARADAEAPADCRDGLAWLADRYERVVERLAALPVAFIHGEFYPSNILVQDEAGNGRVCPVDWEMAALGPGLVDLAALTAGQWSDDERRSLALAYRDELAARGARVPDVDELLAALDFCQVHLSVQWLGWSHDWSPPPGRTRDWLADALRLAGRLGLGSGGGPGTLPARPPAGTDEHHGGGTMGVDVPDDKAAEALRPARGYPEAEWETGHVWGWILVPDAPLDAVQVLVNGEPAGSGKIEAWPDIGRTYPRIPHARMSGYRVAVGAGRLRPDRVNRVTVVGCQGGRPVARVRTLLFSPAAMPLTPAPPPEFIEKTQGDHNADAYRMLGFRYYNQFVEAIARHRDPAGVRRLLDWACGSGRVAANFLLDPRRPEVSGIDIDEGAIAWCQENLPGGHFARQENPWPPLPYPDGHFDAALALGVFAAFDAEGQAQWLPELRRVLAPGGLLLASAQGAFAASFLFPPDALQALARDGILDGARHAVPGSLRGAAQGYFLTPDYVAREWSRYFEVLDHLEGEINTDQDLIVLRRPA